MFAIADLLRVSPGQQIELPVLLADAIYSPARDPRDEEDVIRYRIGSAVANLDVILPAELALDRRRLDKVFDVMSAAVQGNLDYAAAAQQLIRRKIATTRELDSWRLALAATYQNVLALHRKKWNGIWFRIVRNFFWSATAGAFDVIAGNPPWVRWSKLPELYRERVKPTCERYDIFSSTPHHGGNELDISAIITFTVADKWLREGGRSRLIQWRQKDHLGHFCRPEGS